jgi:hypothetical protein
MKLMKIIRILLLRVIAMFSIATETTAFAAGRTNFVSNYPCQEGQKQCLSSGVRVIDGFQV